MPTVAAVAVHGQRAAGRVVFLNCRRAPRQHAVVIFQRRGAVGVDVEVKRYLVYGEVKLLDPLRKLTAAASAAGAVVLGIYQ
mgnify:CR=1 FL=1